MEEKDEVDLAIQKPREFPTAPIEVINVAAVPPGCLPMIDQTAQETGWRE